MNGGRRSAVVLAIALFISYAYFYQAGGWNQNSRFALVRALLERHTVQIDAYAEHTGDRALWRGHYYTDKAPGASLLALAPVALTRQISRAVGVDPESHAGVVLSSYVATIATSALFTTIAALCVFFLCMRWGSTRQGAVFAATAYGLAGPAWCYATLFVGHAITAGCLMLAFAASVALLDRRSERPWLGWVIGLASGVAVLTEFPAAIPVLLICGLALFTVRRRGTQQATPVLVRIVAAGVVCAAILAAYHTVAFGSPLQIGYGNEDNVEGVAMKGVGFFGITYPTLRVTYEVLLGKYRGLLPLAPLAALAPIGWVRLARTSSHRLPVVVAVLIVVFYFLLNISYKYWEGGWFYGPRHVTPALPFLALGLGGLWDRWHRIGRAVLVFGWLWGFAITLVAVTTTPQPPSTVESPVTQLMWPAFREGDLALNNQRFVDRDANRDRLRNHPADHAAWNLGEFLKLSGLQSLLPLAAVWIFAVLLLL